MEDLKGFVRDVVTKWQTEKGKLYKESLSEDMTSVEIGNNAEEYIKRKLKSKDSAYEVVRTPGSRSPIDVIGFASKYGYKHFIMIQVKSSTVENNIYSLSKEDWAKVKLFVTFFSIELRKTNYYKNNKDMLFVLSTGDAKVISPASEGGHQKFKSAQNKGIYTINKNGKDISNINSKIKDLHKLIK